MSNLFDALAESGASICACSCTGVAFLTPFAGAILAVLVGDYLTKLARVPEMEGQRGMTVFFLCVPFGIFTGLATGIISSVVVRGSDLLDS